MSVRIICKDSYLSDKVVASFLEFLAEYISGRKSFSHKYYDRKLKQHWKCISVFDAYEKYSYPLVKEFRTVECSYSNFKANSEALNGLKNKMRYAYKMLLDQKDLAGKKHEEDLLKASQEVFIWGGVAGAKTRGKNTTPGNYLWLEEKYPKGVGLVKAYMNARETMTSNKPDLEKIGKSGVRSNAGFTKIYSLLFDDFIIYDSRVAAALGLFIAQYCMEKSINQIPDVLNFGWMPPKEAKTQKSPKLRNANFNGLEFDKANSEQRHASSNIRANWIFSKLFEDTTQLETNQFDVLKNKQEKIRALEAAFFMLGYDLGNHPWIASHAQQNESVQSEYSHA